jgi:actin-related protein 4
MDVDMEDVEEQEKPLSDNPLLMTEPGRTTLKSREKCIEIAMENWGVPAFWMGRSGVLSTYVRTRTSFGSL